MGPGDWQTSLLYATDSELIRKIENGDDDARQVLEDRRAFRRTMRGTDLLATLEKHYGNASAREGSETDGDTAE